MSETDVPVVPVFFLSDSTGISAETIGNAILLQLPERHFDRTTIPFISTPAEAARVVKMIDDVADGPVTPLVFTTAAEDAVRLELLKTRAPIIDIFDLHMSRVEEILGDRGVRRSMQMHGVRDVQRYNTRMAAVEFTIEHDDGQSLRAMEKADVILLAPSRCGKTPTSMYLALQHGLFVANYPLVDEDLEDDSLPRPVEPYRERCFGLISSPDRLSRVRQERRPDSRYASTEQVRWELRRATELYRKHKVPVIDSSAKSVEEISALVVQTLTARANGRRPTANPTRTRLRGGRS